MPATTTIIPVILSGGSGTRLWPMSTPEKPKQLLALTADETMLQLTARRTAGEAFGAPIVVANAAPCRRDRGATGGHRRGGWTADPRAGRAQYRAGDRARGAGGER